MAAKSSGIPRESILSLRVARMVSLIDQSPQRSLIDRFWAEIVIISRDSWTKIGTFSEDGHSSVRHSFIASSPSLT